MAQLKKVVDPFGEVNVHPLPGGKLHVTATILMEPRREGTQTGIALDGSASMSELYGVAEESGGFFASLFGAKKKTAHNEITPVAQKLCAYLARKLDADGGTTCIYWATGPGGSKIEVIGDLTADQAEKHIFGPPRDFGSFSPPSAISSTASATLLGDSTSSSPTANCTIWKRSKTTASAMPATLPPAAPSR